MLVQEGDAIEAHVWRKLNRHKVRASSTAGGARQQFQNAVDACCRPGLVRMGR
jgi:hypothetical protein